MWWCLGWLLSCGEGVSLDSGTPPPSAPEEAPCDACEGDCTVATFACTAAVHVEGGVDYPNGPPACGDHDPCWAAWGVHEVDPGDERWVHNLEHGGVVFLYDCPDGCPGDVAALTTLTTALPMTILTPHAGMPARFGIVAWGHRWLADCVDLDAMRAFYEEYVDSAPESVTAPPSGSCMP